MDKRGCWASVRTRAQCNVEPGCTQAYLQCACVQGWHTRTFLALSAERVQRQGHSSNEHICLQIWVSKMTL